MPEGRGSNLPGRIGGSNMPGRRGGSNMPGRREGSRMPESGRGSHMPERRYPLERWENANCLNEAQISDVERERTHRDKEKCAQEVEAKKPPNESLAAEDGVVKSETPLYTPKHAQPKDGEESNISQKKVVEKKKPPDKAFLQPVAEAEAAWEERREIGKEEAERDSIEFSSHLQDFLKEMSLPVLDEDRVPPDKNLSIRREDGRKRWMESNLAESEKKPKKPPDISSLSRKKRAFGPAWTGAKCAKMKREMRKPPAGEDYSAVNEEGDKVTPDLGGEYVDGSVNVYIQ